MKVKNFLTKRLGLAAGVTGSLVVGVAGLNYVFTVNETSKPTPTPTQTVITTPKVTPTTVPTPTVKNTVTPVVSPTQTAKPVVTPKTTPTVQATRAALTEKDNSFLNAVQTSSGITQEDKEELKKFPNSLVLVGKESCKYKKTLFVSGAGVAVKATGNEAFSKKFSNKPALYAAIHDAAKSTICK